MFKNSYNVPAFLTKLWDMVNDPKTDYLICWGPSGNSFIIQNQIVFWYELLPSYYKHNNMSSFVRQLNMYGFHKISTSENGSMDTEKDEIQFYHEYFKKGQKHLLKNIKRKQVTGSKIISTNGSSKPLLQPDDLNKVLADVKQLKGRQASVDSQLSAMKQENSVLWRELALLRQKHLKQQQIVNKLIQFLVSIVQPATRLSVKRHYPLMLDETPKKAKKMPSASSDGPTIHELDNDVLPETYLNEDIDNAPELDVAELDLNIEKQVASPACSTKSTCSNNKSESEQPTEESATLATDKEVDLLLAADLLEPNEEEIQEMEQFYAPEYSSTDDTDNPKEVFLNSTSQDKLLSNLISGSYNASALNKSGSGVKKDNDKYKTNDTKLKPDDMAVATRDSSHIPLNRLSSVFGTKRTKNCCSEDLEIHVESSQTELDQLKELLNGCSTLDANALLGNAGGSALKLFNDDTGLPYELNCNQNNLLVSGSELQTYGSGLLDFSQLFDDTSEAAECNESNSFEQQQAAIETINTPQIEPVETEPKFPVKE